MEPDRVRGPGFHNSGLRRDLASGYHGVQQVGCSGHMFGNRRRSPRTVFNLLTFDVFQRGRQHGRRPDPREQHAGQRRAADVDGTGAVRDPLRDGHDALAVRRAHGIPENRIVDVRRRIVEPDHDQERNQQSVFNVHINDRR